jgi:hypothetical protein
LNSGHKKESERGNTRKVEHIKDKWGVDMLCTNDDGAHLGASEIMMLYKQALWRPRTRFVGGEVY